MSGGDSSVAHRLESPSTGTGAIAAIVVTGDLDAMFARLAMAPVRVGEARVRRIASVDEVFVTRWSERCAHITAHAGPAIVRGVLKALEDAGSTLSDDIDPVTLYPEATSVVEAHMLETLARAASPLAIDVLMRQPERWANWRGEPHSEVVRSRSAALDRLVSPPTVAAIGASNIGKSSLLNALAGREAAIVADEPGTTRDHVGAMVDLNGLVVRWVDCPGEREGADEVESEARRLADAMVRDADLVLSCADAGADWVQAPTGAACLRVALRRDLGERAGGELAVSARTGEGLDDLRRRVRNALVPPEALAYEGPWLFDARLAPKLGFA